MSEIIRRAARYEKRGARSGDLPFDIWQTKRGDTSLYYVDPNNTPGPDDIDMVLTVDNQSRSMSKMTLQGAEHLRQPRLLAMLAETAFYGIGKNQNPVNVGAVASSIAEEQLYIDTLGVRSTTKTAREGSQRILIATPQQIVAYAAETLTEEDFYHVSYPSA